MSMFDWQAGPGQQVVASRFWVYWAVATPLTMVVLVIWGFWVWHHNKSETPEKIKFTNTSIERRETKNFALATSSKRSKTPDVPRESSEVKNSLAGDGNSRSSKITWPWYGLFGVKVKVDTIEEGRDPNVLEDSGCSDKAAETLITTSEYAPETQR